jgi:hypothetical protein
LQLEIFANKLPCHYLHIHVKLPGEYKILRCEEARKFGCMSIYHRTRMRGTAEVFAAVAAAKE